MKHEHRAPSGFTVIELLAMLLVLFLLAILFSLALGHEIPRSPRVKCINNLKNVALAARIFSTDNGDVMPGVFYGSNLVSLDAAQFFRYLSNELSTPRVLYCPEDRGRKSAESFTNFAAKNISYFFSLVAEETTPNCFLAGDRNLQVNGREVTAGVLTLTTNVAAGWSRDIHHEQGDIAMADGSVQQFNASRLPVGIREQGVATNRLLMP